MNGPRNSIVCVARDEVKAVRILDELSAARFPKASISVLVPEQAVPGGFDPGAENIGVGVANGAQAKSGLLGGALKDLTEVGILTRPELERLVGAGPLMTHLNAPRAFADSKGFHEDLVQAGIPPEQAQLFEDCLRDGRILVSALCQTAPDCGRLEMIFLEAGADHVVQFGWGFAHSPCSGGAAYQRAA